MVSIVVPVYNVEQFIGKCITSILEQTYQDWELILIDDGTEDNSGEICDEYAKEDFRIKVVHQKNHGVSVARNIGIEWSQGDYITFLDPDDFLPKEYLECMMNCLMKYSADVVIGNMCDIRVSGTIIGFETDIKKPEVITSGMAMEQCLYERRLVPTVCGKIFKRGACGTRMFRAGCVLAEDVWALYGVLNKKRRVALCNDAIYYVCIRSGSAQRSSFTAHKLTALELCEKIAEESCKRGQENIYKAAIAKLVAVSFHVLLQMSSRTPVEYRAYCWERIKKYRCKVLLDSKAKRKARLACFLSFFGENVLTAAFVLSEKIKRYAVQ